MPFSVSDTEILSDEIASAFGEIATVDGLGSILRRIVSS
jgi:hypothetical protein